jgi:hypothetical protein
VNDGGGVSRGVDDAAPAELDIGLIVGCAVGGLVCLICVIVLIVLLTRRGKRSKAQQPAPQPATSMVAFSAAPSQANGIYGPASIAGAPSDSAQPVYSSPRGMSPTPTLAIGHYGPSPANPTVSYYGASLQSASSGGDVYLPLGLRGDDEADGLVMASDVHSRPAAPLPGNQIGSDYPSQNMY